jgi:hypothetical protein
MGASWFIALAASVDHQAGVSGSFSITAAGAGNGW